MTHHDAIKTVESEWKSSSEESMRKTGRYSLIGAIASPVVVVLVVVFADEVASGAWRYAVVGGIMLVLSAIVGYTMWRGQYDEQLRGRALATDLEQQLTSAVQAAELEAERRVVQVHRQEFETRFANALEMAQDEPEVLAAVERAMALSLPDSPAELLLADNSHAHLIRMASSTPTGEAPGCPVESPDHCPAARRAQVQQFTDSDALDSCPKLRDRARGRCSAVCVPVSIMGRTVGVIHATNEPNVIVDDTTVTDLSTLAKLAGARIGLLRVMAETQLQAATDSLTGLLNRRSLENKVRVLRASGTPLTVAIADLDHFKQLNDTHGHETGDRALRLFAHVLESSLRSEDVVARYGGEEFVVVMPVCSADRAKVALDHTRDAVEAAASAAGLPAFTASFGIVEAADDDGDLSDVLARADAALFRAKRAGRNRVVVHGSEDDLVTATLPATGNGNGNGSGPADAEAVSSAPPAPRP